MTNQFADSASVGNESGTTCWETSAMTVFTVQPATPTARTQSLPLSFWS